MAVNELSLSEKYRQKGNDEYQRYSYSTNLQSQKALLEKSIGLYRLAYDAATSDKERASSAKNLGTASSRLASLLKSLMETYVSATLDSVTYLSKALYYGHLANMGEEWIASLSLLYSTFIRGAVENLVEEVGNNLEKIIESVEQLISVMFEDSQKSACFDVLAERTYNEGAKLIAEKDYQEATRLLNYCHRPAEECRRLASLEGNEGLEKLHALRLVELESLLSVAESFKDLDSGDKTLRLALVNEDELSMDLVFDAMDLYRAAAGRSRALEVEVEAIAMSKLGSLYHNVLKMKWKAKDYYTLSMQLAMSMHPRVFTEDAWFKGCIEALEMFQEENAREVELKKNKERQKLKVELADDLREIEQSDVGENPMEFLKYLYEKYPPKNPSHKLSTGECKSKKQQKKALTRAVLHYHPDKQNEEEHGLKWIVFCTEILTRLNRRFGDFKCVPDDEEDKDNDDDEKNKKKEEKKKKADEKNHDEDTKSVNYNGMNHGEEKSRCNIQ